MFTNTLQYCIILRNFLCYKLFVHFAIYIDAVVVVRVYHVYQTDEDIPQAFTQTFYLKPIGTSFFVLHDIFRLVLHDQA